MNSWILLAFLAPVFLALSDVLTKKVNITLDEYTVSLFRNLFSLPVFWIVLFIVGLPKVDPNFWKVLIFIIPFEVVLAICYFRAIKSSPLSLTVPFSAFVPVTGAIGAFFILGEKIGNGSVLAILFMVFGSYLMNLNFGKNSSFLEPFKMLQKEKGPQFMLLSTLLLGIILPVGKILVGYSSSYFYSAVYFSTFCLVFLPLFFMKTKNSFKDIRVNFKWLVPIGIFNGIFLLFFWIASATGSVGVVNSANKLSILFTVILAGTYLRERGFLQRLIASICMVTGAVMVVLLS